MGRKIFDGANLPTVAGVSNFQREISYLPRKISHSAYKSLLPVHLQQVYFQSSPAFLWRGFRLQVNLDVLRTRLAEVHTYILKEDADWHQIWYIFVLSFHHSLGDEVSVSKDAANPERTGGLTNWIGFRLSQKECHHQVDEILGANAIVEAGG